MGMLRNGVPSEATLCRVEQGIDELSMADRMQAFAQAYHARLLKDKAGMDIICVDGKAIRGTVLADGSSPDIVSAYSPSTGITLATEACQEKSNEIKAVPRLIDRIDVAGKILTADAMSMQKDIIDKIRKKGGDFLIELKANQRSLRYGIEDRIRTRTPLHSYTEGPELGHGRIETRTYRIHDGLDMIADREKWGGGMTVVEYESDTVLKSTGARSTERRLYVTSLASTLHREAALCDKPGDGHAPAGRHSAHALGHREHALGAGRQSSTGQDQTTVRKIGSQPGYDPKNSPLGVLHLEEAAKKEGGQKKRGRRDYETRLGELHETHPLLVPKMKKIRF